MTEAFPSELNEPFFCYMSVSTPVAHSVQPRLDEGVKLYPVLVHFLRFTHWYQQCEANLVNWD